MTAASPRMRLGVLGVVVLSLFAALFARLWFLQVMSAPDFEVAARSNILRVVPLTPLRGRLLDRNGGEIARNRLSSVVTADREALVEPEERRALFASVSPVIGVPVEEMERRWNDSRYSLLTPLPLAEDLPEPVVVELSERQDEFPGVRTETVAVREYPYGTLAAHVLGYVGEIGPEELEERAGADYQLGDVVGKAGVERTYEKELRGIPGSVTLEVDAQGRVLGEVDRVEPVPGNDVQLTLDLGVQTLVERTLAEGLEAARGRRARDGSGTFAAPAGSAVVLDPRDGAVVAMASHPSYRPADFLNGISNEVYAYLNDPANHLPLNNRALQGQYAPGSTFKLITAAAALRHGMITPETTIVDNGVYVVPDCRGRCTFSNAGRIGNGRVAISRAISVSSDVFFYSLGADFWRARDVYGEEALQDEARAFGLGAESGVPLPSEQDGRVYTPELRRADHEERPDAYPDPDWRTGDNLNMAIGQGELLATPMQLTNAYATFANGGTRYAPNVVSRILAPGGGEVLREVGARAVGEVDLPPAVRDPIMTGLVGVLSAERGTAQPAFAGFPLDAYPLAGKTGTAQTGGDRRGSMDTSLFTAFGPVGAPEYVVTAVLEQAGFGSSVAAPVVRRIFEGLAGLVPLPAPTPEGVAPAPPPEDTGVRIQSGASD